MNMNTIYVMLAFIFVYAIIANIRDKILIKTKTRNC